MAVTSDRFPFAESFRLAASKARQTSPGPDGIGYRFGAVEESVALARSVLGNGRWRHPACWLQQGLHGLCAEKATNQGTPIR